MDILDLVALMQKYAEENSEILEFEQATYASVKKELLFDAIQRGATAK